MKLVVDRLFLTMATLLQMRAWTSPEPKHDHGHNAQENMNKYIQFGGRCGLRDSRDASGK